MSDELKVDCFECKDLEFARNLARSMKDGYGRHNSNRDFERNRRALDAVGLAFRAHEARHVGGLLVRDSPEKCAIGEAFPFDAERDKYQVGFMRVRVPEEHLIEDWMGCTAQHVVTITLLRFERVHWRQRDGGVEVFWKRIE